MGDARSLAPGAQAQLRLRAIAAVRQGHTQTEVAELFGVSLRAVQKWVARAKRGGLAALKARARGRPKGTQLTGEQAKKVTRLCATSGPIS